MNWGRDWPNVGYENVTDYDKQYALMQRYCAMQQLKTSQWSTLRPRFTGFDSHGFQPHPTPTSTTSPFNRTGQVRNFSDGSSRHVPSSSR